MTLERDGFRAMTPTHRLGIMGMMQFGIVLQHEYYAMHTEKHATLIFIVKSALLRTTTCEIVRELDFTLITIAFVEIGPHFLMNKARKRDADSSPAILASSFLWLQCCAMLTMFLVLYWTPFPANAASNILCTTRSAYRLMGEVKCV